MHFTAVVTHAPVITVLTASLVCWVVIAFALAVVVGRLLRARDRQVPTTDMSQSRRATAGAPAEMSHTMTW